MRCYQMIRRTPTRELSIAEHGQLQLERAMLSVRAKANEIRASKWMSADNLRYQVGFFNGVRFSIMEALDYQGSEFYEFLELSERYSSEVDYLSTGYLER